jgi:hypothetical protein
MNLETNVFGKDYGVREAGREEGFAYAWDRVDDAMRRDREVRDALLAACEDLVRLLDRDDRPSIVEIQVAVSSGYAAIALARGNKETAS